MNDNTAKTIDEKGNEVLDPRKALEQPTLAVDLARAEIDQQIATAHKFPRVYTTVVEQIRTLACYNKESADNCIYALPRGGKPIVGPSIGFANIVKQAWGNCRVSARIVHVDRMQKVVICEGGFLDLQSNTMTVTPVTRRIVDKNGRIYNDDMINVTGMAAASIATRNAILNGVSRGLWFPIWQEALAIVRGSSDAVTFAERKTEAWKAMAQFGVKPEQVLMLLGLKSDADLTFEHIPTIRGMFVALRDGSMTVEELLDPKRMTGGAFEQVDNPLGDDMSTGAVAPGEDANTPKQAQQAQPAASIPGQQNQNVVQLPQKSAESAREEAQADPTKETYLAFWKQKCEALTTVTAVRNAYAAERKRRVDLGISEDIVEQCAAIRDTRIEALGK